MQFARWFTVIISVLLLVSCSSTGGVRLTQVSDALAFTDVSVIPMDSERVLRNQTVVVRDGLIDAMGPSALIEIPRGARRIDGAGRYLMPGLTDFHVHLRDTTELLSYLAYGVTAVVHLSGPTGNVTDVFDLRRRVSSGAVLGPTIYTAGHVLDGDPPIFPDVSTTVRTPEEALRIVGSQIDAGVDFVKVYNNLSAAALGVTIATAHDRQVAVIGHIPRSGGRAQALQTALLAGLDVVAHGEEYFFTFFYGDVDSRLDQGLVPSVDEGRIPEAVRLTKEYQVAVTPNLSFVAMTRAQLDDLGGVLGDPEARFLHPAVLNMWRQQNPTTRPDLERFERRERAKYRFLQKLTIALNDAGVPLLLGTDASAAGLFPGRAVHVELTELVKVGLTPYQALATGTRNAGAFIASHTPAKPFGTLAPGSRADLILLRRNPLEDVANAAAIEGVLVRGAWFSSADLQNMRETFAAAHTR